MPPPRGSRTRRSASASPTPRRPPALHLVLDSSPVAASYLYYGEALSSVTTGPTDTLAAGGFKRLSLSGAGGEVATTASTAAGLTNGRNVFVTADVPGAHTFHFVDTMGTPGVDDDATSATITMTVKDVDANTATTTDDWLPGVTAPGSMAYKAPLPTSVDLSALTVSDSRGSSATAGPYLGTATQARVGVRATGTGNVEATATATSGVTGSKAVRVVSNANGTSLFTGDATVTPYLDPNGDDDFTIAAHDGVAIGTAATTIVGADNTATGVALSATDVVGTALKTGAAVAVKTGTGAVTYSATVTGAGGAAVANVPVYFTATPSTNTPQLSSSGSTYSPGTTYLGGTKIFSATTNSSGVASLTLTPSVTTVGTVYTVDAATNNVTGATLTTTYADQAASTIALTNTAATPTTR